MTPEEEVKFTILVTNTLEPNCSGDFAYSYIDKLYEGFHITGSSQLLPADLFNMGLVIDAEGKPLALCPDWKTAICLAELINYACENRPFTNPEDPTIIRVGL